MEAKLRERINQFMEAEGLSVNSLAKAIGVQTRTLNNQIKTETAISAATLLEILFKYKNVSAEWLLRGEGEMYLSGTNGDAELRDQLRRKDREIDGLYERIAELKRGDITAAPSAANIA